MATISKSMSQTLGNTTATTTTKLIDNGCNMIPANGPFGNKTIGPRTVIVPADPIIWNEGTSYEYLTLVATSDFGDSYVSKRDVPSGTPLTDKRYWIHTSSFNAQLANIQEIIDKIQNITGNINFVTPEQYGAIGDGETDDTQAFVSALASGLPVMGDKSKTYNVTNIDLPSKAYISNCSFLKKKQGTQNYILGYNTQNIIIYNCSFVSYLDDFIGIKGSDTADTVNTETHALISNVDIEGTGNSAQSIGIYTGTIRTDISFLNVMRTGIGLQINCTDSNYSNFEFVDCPIGVDVHGSTNRITNIQPWGWEKECIGVKINNSVLNTIVTNFICDTLKTGILVGQYSRSIFNNIDILWNGTAPVEYTDCRLIRPEVSITPNTTTCIINGVNANSSNSIDKEYLSLSGLNYFCPQFSNVIADGNETLDFKYIKPAIIGQNKTATLLNGFKFYLVNAGVETEVTPVIENIIENGQRQIKLYFDIVGQAISFNEGGRVLTVKNENYTHDCVQASVMQTLGSSILYSSFNNYEGELISLYTSKAFEMTAAYHIYLELTINNLIRGAY